MSGNLPAASVTKNTFTTSQAPADTTGILAICAASSTGTAYTPGGFTRSDLAVNALGYGPLTEYAAYTLAAANKGILAIKSTPTFPGTYGTLSKTVAGTSVVTNGATAPYDRGQYQVTIVAGGTIGVAGITFTWSADGGQTVSGVTALGTASTLTIPNTGVSFALAAGTLIAGDTWSVYTERPLMNDADCLLAMTALQNTRLPFEGVLLDSSCTSSTVGLIDAVLATWETKGVFKFVVLNSRMKVEPASTGETEAAYATALQTTFQNQTSIRMCVGADGAHAASLISGANTKRPTSMFLAARAMAIPLGEDPAYVGRGPLLNAQVANNAGNPQDHDEDLFPGLDALRLTSLRSFAPAGPQGVYVCNANTIQPSGGAYPYLQHVRVANRACEIAWAVLTRLLSLGVRKNPSPDKVTGAVYIFEPDAAFIEAQVNDALAQAVKGNVSDIRFTLSRTDDMNANPVTVNAVLAIVALAYVKNFQVQQQFVKSLSTTL